MDELRLAGPKLAEDFGEGSSLDAAAENRVELLGSRGDPYDLFATEQRFRGGVEGNTLCATTNIALPSTCT